jgi:hypothetical protein
MRSDPLSTVVAVVAIVPGIAVSYDFLTRNAVFLSNT